MIGIVGVDPNAHLHRPDDASAEGVVQAYFDAWNTRDIDQIMSHVAEDASLEIDPAGVMWDTDVQP